jgi:mRNA interferase MazF
MQRKVKQKEIYMCDLTLDSVDSEQKGIHPVLVYSCDIRNNSSSNVNIFPLTHAFKKSQPTHYILYKSDYDFLSYDESTIECEECRSISKERLERYLGRISEEDFEKILICNEFVFKKKKKEDI